MPRYSGLLQECKLGGVFYLFGRKFLVSCCVLGGLQPYPKYVRLCIKSFVLSVFTSYILLSRSIKVHFSLGKAIALHELWFFCRYTICKRGGA